MKEYFICEIDDEKKMLRFAIDGTNTLLITNKLLKAPANSGIYGFAIYKSKLYPVVTHMSVEGRPKLKYFVVFPEFAFGVTRLLDRVATELSEKIISTTQTFGNYMGTIEYLGETVFVYDITKVQVPKEAEDLAHEVKKEELKSSEKEFERVGEFLLLGKKLVVRTSDVLSILPSNNITRFQSGEYIGFTEFKDTVIPVIFVQEGNYLVVVGSKAYLCQKIENIVGTVVKNTDGEILEVYGQTYPIVKP